MNTTVLVIGPSDLVERTIEVGEEYDDITFISAPYVHEQETIKIIKEFDSHYDILLFSGPIPYHIAKHENTEKPMVYIPAVGTSLYKVFFTFMKESNFRYLDVSLRCSFDTIEQAEVKDCLEELEVSYQNIFTNQDQDADQLIAYHYQLWRDGLIDVAITCVRSVYEALKKRGVMVYRVVPTKSAISVSLQNVRLEAKSLMERNTQIAIGILQIENMVSNRDYQTQRKRAFLQNILIDFCEDAKAIFEWSERDEVRIVTTRGAIEDSTSRYQELNILSEISMKTNLVATLGIGFGHSAHEAEINARVALSKANADRPSCFMVDQDGMVYGPVGKSGLKYSLRSQSAYQIELAKQSGLSIATINKIFSVYENMKTTEITSMDLANQLGLTVRSASRILHTLEHSHLASVVGEEQPIHRGRPRHLYRLDLFKNKTKPKKESEGDNHENRNRSVGARNEHVLKHKNDSSTF